MKQIFTLSILVLLFKIGTCQPDFPKRGHVFNNDLIPKVHLTLPEDNLQWLYDHIDSDEEFEADFVFESGDSFDTVTHVGLRLRGNTSRESAKKSFKISFNSFVSNQKYKELEKMNLNGEHNDPSIMRSYLFWNLSHDMLVQGSRANHVELYINNRYYGLYMNVEHVDEEFIEKRYIDNHGNLYKCLYGADWSYLGADAQKYIDKNYTLETNKEAGDYSHLIYAIKTLNESTNEQLPVNFEPVFNVNAFLRYLAIETFTSNWDGYSYNENNYYLYENQLTGKIEFLPYDVDNTFGIDWFGVDWGTRDIYNWTSDWGNRSLTKKILANQIYKDRYSFFLNQLVTNYAAIDTIFPKIDKMKLMINESAENDTYRPLDYGWTFDDFNRSYIEALGAHVKYGLKPYIETRVNSIKNQLQLNAIAPIVENIYHNYPTIHQEIQVTLNLTDDEPNPTARLYYSINGGNDQYTDFTLTDHDYYLAKAPAMGEYGDFNYYVLATDASGKTTRDPVSGYYEIKLSTSTASLAINEFMADNPVSVLDNYGQYDDWIEIMNTGTTAVNLKGKYLTDNFDMKTQWALPDTTIQPGGFYMVWADDDAKQGRNHTNFKLGKNGDQIGLFEGIENNYAAIDTITFGAQTSNISFGKTNGIWKEQNIFTPGGTNEDANYAFITFSYNMSQQVALGQFDLLMEYIDIAGNYNNWYGDQQLVDGDGDGIIRGAVFGFTKGQQIEFKARMEGDWNRCEFKSLGNEGNRKYKVTAGKNNLLYWFNDEPLSLDDHMVTAELNLFPNPSSGMVKVFTGISEGKITFYTLTGQIVEERMVTQTTESFNLSALQKGIYLVVYESTSQEQKIAKLVIQ